MENGKLIFVDEKECGQVCSTIILAHCPKGQQPEPSINIGRTIIQKEGTNYNIKLCNLKDVLGYLKMLTPSELAINARDLMTNKPPSEESSDRENIFSVDGLVFRNFDIHQGSVVYISGAKLDIKNLRYDVDKLEVRRLQTEVFERFEVQTVLYGDEVNIPNEKRTLVGMKIYPFIYMYIPYFLAKTLKEHFEQTHIDLDIIGTISLTENYICFKRKEGRFGSKGEFLGFLYDSIDGNVLKVEKENIDPLEIKSYFENGKEVYKELEEDGNLPPGSTNPASLSKVIFEEKFDFGIKPVALWLV